jgi:hypothetical protein
MCWKKISTSILFKWLSTRFNLDFHVNIKVAKDFSGHVALPKQGFIEYVESVKIP